MIKRNLKDSEKSKKSVSIFQKRLNSMRDIATGAMDTYTQDGSIPEGVFNAREQCELRESKAGNLMVARTFTVVDGDYKARKIWDNVVLGNNEYGWHNLRRWMEVHGDMLNSWPGNGEDMGIIEENIVAINNAAPLVQIRVKQSVDKTDETKIYTNVTVMQMLEDIKGSVDDNNNNDVDIGVNADIDTIKDNAETTDLESMTRKELKKFIDSNPILDGIRVTVKMSTYDIREAIRDAMIGTEEAKETEETEETEEVSEYDAEALLAFCVAQGIDDVNDEMDIQQIVDIMKGYNYKKTDLTQEEVDMLGTLDLKGHILPESKKAEKMLSKKINKK